MTAQAFPLNDAAVASLGLCDNDCGRPAVSGFGRGLYKHCSRACERANVTTFDRETVRQLRQESEAAMAEAARDSAKDVAVLEAAEAERAGKVRVKVPIAPKVAPAPVAAPIQAADVVAVESKPEPAGEPPKPKEPKPRKARPLVPFEIDPSTPQGKCRRIGCKYPDDKVVRGFCDSDEKVARRRGIYEELALPKRIRTPRAKKVPRKPGDKQIVEFVAKNPGCTYAECAAAVSLQEDYVISKSSVLRGKNLLAPIAPKASASSGRMFPFGYDVPTEPVSFQSKILKYIEAHPGCTSRDIDAAIPGHKAGESVSIMRKAGLLPPSFARNHRLFGRLFLHSQNPDAFVLPRVKHAPPPPDFSERTLAIIKRSGALGASQSAITAKLGVSRSTVRRALKKLLQAGEIKQNPDTLRYLSTSKG